MSFDGYFRRGRFAGAAFLLALCLFFSSRSHLRGQSSRGTVSGLVLDSTKSPIVSAKVDLTNEDTKVTRTTQTNEAGNYRFDAVDPGPYTVKVTSSGFKGFSVAPFTVAAARGVAIDAQLEIGAVTSTVEVSASAAQLQTEAPVRGGTITTQSLTELPIASQNPVSLVLTLPGVSTNRYSFGVATFSVNGARGRSNNFLIDGTENNDISIAGQAFQIKNPDAVQEVSAQTGNYDAEYGRAGGAVINTITRSGTNQFHGTLRYLLDSTFDDALTNLNKLDAAQLRRGHPAPGTDQYFSGTIGGPIFRNKTFFFSAYQEERQVSSSTTQLTSLSAAGRATLLSAFPGNDRVKLLNDITTGYDATSQFFNVASGANRPAIEFGTYTRSYPSKVRDRQLLERVDHVFSNQDQLSGRYLYDDSIDPFGGTVGFPGFSTSQTNTVNSALLTETHTFSPVSTNELRLAYNRIFFFFPFDATNPLAAGTPQTTINGVGSGSLYGVASNLPQGRVANNYEIQDTVSYVRGNHSIRGGISLLQQRSKQAAPFNVRGTLNYQTSSGGVTGLTNFIDDYGGSNGSAARDFGSASYYPSLFRQAYFLQDRWRATESLTVTLGVRYEFFGNPINSLRTPAYAGIFNVDPRTFTGPYSQPNQVNSDLNNWSPTVGLAYSPASGGPFGIFGQKKTVLRGGFQMGYDSFFNNIASNAVASAPNNIATIVNSVSSAANPRGLAGLSGELPASGVFSPLNTQTLALKNLVNSYYMRWSGGFQRELPGKVIVDASYVGTRGLNLFATEDLNPLVPTSLQNFPAGYSAANIPAANRQSRFDPLSGARNIRTNGAGSIYHSGQLGVTRRFANDFLFNLAYTRSKFIDNGSDIFGVTGNNQNSTAVTPSIFGGLTQDRAVSNYDRPNRVSLTAVYDLPFMRAQHGLIGHVFGGWQLSGVYVMESGAPLNITNGVEADGLGSTVNDRPNFNPAGTFGVRAIPASARNPSPTGYINPDAGNAPIDPATAMYIALPACDSTTPCATGNLGRNTARTPILNNLDANLTKIVNITERVRFELRGEFYNVFNHRQYGTQSISPFDSGTVTIGANATSTPGGINPATSRFLNPGFADGGARVIRYQLKFIF